MKESQSKHRRLGIGFALVAAVGAFVWAIGRTGDENAEDLHARDARQAQGAESGSQNDPGDENALSTEKPQVDGERIGTDKIPSQKGDPSEQRPHEKTSTLESGKRDGIAAETAKSNSSESRRRAAEAAENIQTLVRGFAGAASRDAVESGLTKSGLVLTRAPASIGATGARSRTETARLGALVTARLDWKGTTENALALEHARLVHANESVDFDDLVANYDRVLMSEGWSQVDARGPRGAVIWRNTTRGLMLVLAPHDAASPHPYEGLPENVSITTIHDDHEH